MSASGSLGPRDALGGGARLVLIWSILGLVGACGVPSLWVLRGRGDLDAFIYLGGN